MECILGGVLHSGQICMSTDRIIIHAEIADKFLEILKATFSAISSSAPDPPLLVNAAAKARLQEVVSKAFSEGASSLLGSIEQLQPKETNGSSPPNEEAMEMANDTEYGLSAAVFTQDLRKGFAIAKRLESGAVHINSMSVRGEPALPMGGVKKSGWGRFNTVLGMEEFLITKSVT
ncbi:c46a2498-fa24-483f-9cf8-2784898a2507 [Sclerotinia trifoliorum]|uniref:C46a2498-fa24-483f-9cf8-2784898a2507 n=1 Tax=Sclerotinia trifoliorum TaxID=28548 RepID=A0A8H2VYU0_9HELO|nr:c46a2498-fa24-483f-9cf8-2784898a2507 [Sclerotinia trifoliorum]